MRPDNWHEGGAAAGQDSLDIEDLLARARAAMSCCGPFEAADLVRRERERTSDGGVGR
jgi:hypothetical protein